jgi:hypothetical protein
MSHAKHTGETPSSSIGFRGLCQNLAFNLRPCMTADHTRRKSNQFPMPSSAQRSSLRIETRPFHARKTRSASSLFRISLAVPLWPKNRNRAAARDPAHSSPYPPLEGICGQLSPVAHLLAAAIQLPFALWLQKILHVVNGPDSCWPAINRATASASQLSPWQGLTAPRAVAMIEMRGGAVW